MHDLHFLLKVVGTCFFILGALNTNIPRTNSIGVGLSLWGIALLS